MSVFENKMLIQNPTSAGDTAELLLYNFCDSLIVECKGSGFKFHIEGQQDPKDIDNWTNISGIALDGFVNVTDITSEGLYQFSTGGLYKIRVYVETPGTDLMVHVVATSNKQLGRRGRVRFIDEAHKETLDEKSVWRVEERLKELLKKALKG